uniref:G-protein coupled receptors family 3 profile domain-containing protein n=1 Tax=Cyprinus carpio TaxID=7962 RepID=A0A8C1GRS2_CYPCA
ENTYMGFWMAAFYVYKGILLVCDLIKNMIHTCFLAWTTCHINIPAINDSRRIQYNVFVSVPVILIGTCAFMLWQDQPNVQFCILTLVIITCCCSTLCMVFIPKIIIIRMDPDTAFLSRRFHVTQWYNGKRSIMEQSNPGPSLNILLSENLNLKRHIKEVRSFLIIKNVHPGTCLGKIMVTLQLHILHHAYLPCIGEVDFSPLNSPFESPQHMPMPRTYGVLVTGL